ncbi:cation:proton antiporter [Vibrio lentus]|nr:cation:proton antiporter [Vibrio lentus]
MSSLAAMSMETDRPSFRFCPSFSSTVFAVKSLQEKREMNATYGTLAIGILVMQDIFAVVFLTASTGKIPEWYAIALSAGRSVVHYSTKFSIGLVTVKCWCCSGIFFALVVGAGLFQFVGVKTRSRRAYPRYVISWSLQKLQSFRNRCLI